MARQSNYKRDLETLEKELWEYYQPTADRKKELQEFLLQLLHTKIAMLEHKTDRSKWLRNFLSVGGLLLSGCATVVLGLKTERGGWWDQYNSNIALILTALATFFGGLMTLWNLNHHWLRNKVMLNHLKELRYELVFHLNKENQPDEVSLTLFLKRLIAIIGDEYWEKLMEQQRKDPPMQKPTDTPASKA